jgi:hypothetical protein
MLMQLCAWNRLFYQNYIYQRRLVKMSNKNKKNQTEEQIQAIQKRYATEICSYKQLAVEYGTTEYQIKKVLEGVTKRKLSDEERFWSKVNRKDNLDECWEWLGTKDRYGYGRFYLNGKKEKAHRVAYEFTLGAIPKAAVIRHKVCRNRSCCNPAHLLPGTLEENQMDKMEDGTNWKKLSYNKVLEANFLKDIGWDFNKVGNYLDVHPRSVSKQLNKIQDENTLFAFTNRAKQIMEKEEANNSPIQIVIDRVIE